MLYDSKLKKNLENGYELFHYSKKTEPIWVTNEKAGKYSGCSMWPGADFEFNEKKCTFSELFDESQKYENRVDTAISWFTHPKTPANLILLYIEQPDMYAHAYGTKSPQVSCFL